MSFKEDHPNYKSYTSSSGLHYSDLPYRFSWSELESLIDEAGGPDREYLSKIVQLIARTVRAGNVDGGFAYQWIPHIVSTIKKRVDEGKFFLFMDCLVVLCSDGDLTRDSLNEFLEDYEIGYRAIRGWNNSIEWEMVENPSDDEKSATDEADDVLLDKPLEVLNRVLRTFCEQSFTAIDINSRVRVRKYIPGTAQSRSDGFDILALGEDHIGARFDEITNWCGEHGKRVVRLKRTPGIASS
ncbi:hypothetical protein [Butyrivibrio fibrisolvens]|uniref:hypothetical protein n=1 Tax=Butyrivibrio fibrisolvens TaxID=831 RepID=UPI000401263B|nr:hypothetical protein [Butyrivibrio fibrisolvens]